MVTIASAASSVGGGSRARALAGTRASFAPGAAPSAAAPAGRTAGAAAANASLGGTASADELRALRAQLQSEARVAKLNGLVEQFAATNDEVHASEWAERDAREARLQALEQTIGRLQGGIVAEVEARAGVLGGIDASLEAQAANLRSAQAARLADARAGLEVDLSVPDNRLERADVVFEQDRIATQRAIERAHASLLETLAELRDALGVEIATRIEREARTAKRTSDELFALQGLTQGEAGAFQASLGHVRDAQEQGAAMLAKSDEAFKHGLLQQLTAAQRELKAEGEARAAVERQLVASLEDYAGGYIDGLKNVNARVHAEG